ncbi:MAG: hypothetical protein HY293_03570, partial [Planctomycetes bacterium]|nr:hypothetical protein [Planctomycetota bacterium]
QSDSGLRKAQSDSGLRKAQSDTAVRKAPTAAVRPSAPAAPPSEPALKDFAFHGAAGGHAGKIVAAVLLVALLGVGGYFGQKYLSLPTVTVNDSDNLLARNAHFDVVAGGKPDGWALRPGLSGDKVSCAATVDPARGRNNSPGLLLDKSGGAGDLVAECAFQDDLTLHRGDYLSASAWTQFEGFNGWAAVKVDWLKTPKGAVIAEEYSDPVKASGWTEIKGTFNPPAGAGAFRFALAIVGRSGRVFFDDVTLKSLPGAPAGPEKKIGKHHKAAYTKAGVLQIELRGGRRTLTNISLSLESEKEGATPQAFSTDVAAAIEEAGVIFKGRMVNPLDFREVAFEERIGDFEDMTNVVYQFTGDTLKQVDRVTIALTLPRVDGPPRGIPEGGEPTSRITCGSEDGDFALEYADPAFVKVRNIDGRFRVFQTWKVDPTAEDPVFVFRIREKGSAQLDPQAALSELRQQGKSGEALTLARDQVKRIKEPPVREKMESEVRQLEEMERRDWAECQALAFQGRISRRPELRDKAFEAIDRAFKRWSGEGTESKFEQLRRDLEKELASTPAADAERPQRIFERAKKYMEGGKRALAQSMLQTLVAKYPSSDVTPQAQQLLKTLSEQP